MGQEFCYGESFFFSFFFASVREIAAQCSQETKRVFASRVGYKKFYLKGFVKYAWLEKYTAFVFE